MQTRAAAATLATVLTLAGTPVALIAGPMNPPAGAIGSTMKTIAEVEPRTAINAVNTPGDLDSLYRITQPGSYYLTGNITGVAGKSGIEVAVSGVTIDLGGFKVTGVAGASTGICVESVAIERLTITNGSVDAWPNGGVRAGVAARLTGVSANGNGQVGISFGEGGMVESCRAKENAALGFDAGPRSMMRNCVALENTGTGIWILHSSRVEHCNTSGNTGAGLALGNLSVASCCTADDNGGHGISAADQSTVTGCSTSSNTGTGINCGYGVEVLRSTSGFNDGPGIRASNGCRIEGNQCRYNGVNATGAGIFVVSGSNGSVIANNNCTGNDTGIEVDGVLCLVKGNTVSGNTTNFDIASGNRVATIVTLPQSGAILGNTGGSNVGTPDANYVY